MMKTYLINTRKSTYSDQSKKARAIYIELVSKLFILLFVYAAVNKFLEFEEFEAQVGQSPLLTSFASWIIWVIPTIEILISCMLVVERYRLLALYAAFSLMIMFTTYIVAILAFSNFIPCSCGGILEKLGWTEHLVFNIVFILLSAFAILLHDNAVSKYKESSSPNEPQAI